MKKFGFILLSTFALVLSGCNLSVTESLIDVNLEKETSYSYTVLKNQFLYFADNVLVRNSNAYYDVIQVKVKEGQRFLVNFSVPQENEIAYVIFGNSNNIVDQYITRFDNYDNYEFCSAAITIPEGGEFLFFNNDRTFKEVSVKELYKEKVNELNISDLYHIDKNEIKVGFANTNEFSDTSKGLSKEQYKKNWEKMFSENEYDFFGYSDIARNYEDYEKDVQEVLSSKGEGYCHGYGYGRGFAISINGIRSLSAACLILPHTYEDVTCNRFIAYRNAFVINKQVVAIYQVHLVGKSNITSLNEDETKVNLMYNELKKAQINGIIEDSKSFDEAIIMGDFEFENYSEYNAWNIAGFKNYNNETLSMIKGSNIVCSEGIDFKIDSFKQLSNYNLNTSYNPIITTLVVK